MSGFKVEAGRSGHKHALGRRDGVGDARADELGILAVARNELQQARPDRVGVGGVAARQLRQQLGQRGPQRRGALAGLDDARDAREPVARADLLLVPPRPLGHHEEGLGHAHVLGGACGGERGAGGGRVRTGSFFVFFLFSFCFFLSGRPTHCGARRRAAAAPARRPRQRADGGRGPPWCGRTRTP